MDATTLLTDEIPQEILNNDFFCVSQFTMRN